MTRVRPAMRAWRQLVGLVLLCWVGVLGAVESDASLERIRAQGYISIGVKTDFPPFGMLDSAGRPIGFEVDLARRLAAALGVEARLVGVSTENRFQRLEQGAVDVIVATAADTAERRQLASVVEPNYYGGGVGVFLRPGVFFDDWPAMRGVELCALQGSYFNKPIMQRHLVKLQMYRSVRDAQLALRDGRCAGFLYTDVAIQQYLKDPDWTGYTAPLPSALIIPWAISVARGEAGSALERSIGDVVAAWHRDGTLIELEGAWDIQPNRFLQEANRLWNAREVDGTLLCERGADGQWPAACRNAAFVTSADVGGLQGIGLWVRETFGLDFSFVYDPFDRDRYVAGILWTLLLCAATIVGSLVFAFIGAAVIAARIPLLSGLIRALGNFGRMTPVLLQMYLVFFWLGGVAWSSYGISLSPVLVAIFCLALYHGSIIAFAFIDAADHIHETHPEFRFTPAFIPELLAEASVGVRNTLTNLVKATSIASAIAVPELLAATIAIMADRGNVFLMMNALLLVFYLMTAFWIHVFERFERRLQARGAA
ncbi:MAG: transporter substrate-binding domain-containing protein [Pseudazoarcus pumilus]|nr:transporter substrate-binding domain-containing protein [Pseudazoarcus pumilus]